jgi:hypothetical protein
LLSALLYDADLLFFGESGNNLEENDDLVGYEIGGGGGAIIIMTGIEPGRCGGLG